MKGKLIIDCDKAASICNKNQYGEAPFFDKIKLVLHIFLCKHCKLYSKQNTMISKICDRHLKEPVTTLSDKDKSALKKNLKDKMPAN